MARRHNHYEAAFEAYLRQQHVPYLAVDEAKRALFGAGQSLKSLDFVLSRPGQTGWLVDVKGRRFPTGTGGQYWKNWSTEDELESLSRWEGLFGSHFSGLLVFAYWLVADRSPLPLEELFHHKDRLYAFVGIRLDHYLSGSRPLSPKWQTVSLPTTPFRNLARPLSTFLSTTSPAPPLVPPLASPLFPAVPVAG